MVTDRFSQVFGMSMCQGWGSYGFTIRWLAMWPNWFPFKFVVDPTTGRTKILSEAKLKIVNDQQYLQPPLRLRNGNHFGMRSTSSGTSLDCWGSIRRPRRRGYRGVHEKRGIRFTRIPTFLNVTRPFHYCHVVPIVTIASDGHVTIRPVRIFGRISTKVFRFDVATVDQVFLLDTLEVKRKIEINVFVDEIMTLNKHK